MDVCDETSFEALVNPPGSSKGGTHGELRVAQVSGVAAAELDRCAEDDLVNAPISAELQI